MAETFDILNPIFSYGVLETICVILMDEKKGSKEQLQHCISEGGESIKPSLDILEGLQIIKSDGDSVSFDKCNILKEWDDNPDTLSLYLKLQILTSIHNSKNPKIHYLSRYITFLFESNSLLSQTDFEQFFQDARANEGIDEEMSISSSGKQDHVKQFLKTMRILQVVGSQMFISIPKDYLRLAFELVLKSNKSNIMSLYSELFHEIQEHYFPILMERTTLLPVVSKVLLSDAALSDKFTYELIPDGGTSISIAGNKVNSIKVV